MIPNLYQADELALIRDRIKRLELREQKLRDGYLSGRLNPVGYENRVEIKVQRRRQLRTDRLPPENREDPRFWQGTETRAVVVRKAGDRGAPIPR
jgi:hypothetical protein